MLLINHPPLGPKSPAYLKSLAALQAISDSPSAFFTTGAPGDAEREELILGTQLFGLPVARRGYLYMLRGALGQRAPSLMTPEQLGKQYLLAAQLFAQARNEFGKAGQLQEELIAFFLAVRCAMHSKMSLPGYLEEMGANFAKAVGIKAETLAAERLGQHDLPGFLALTTIAFSAYDENTLPLGKPELKRFGGLTVRSLTQLVEHLKADKGKHALADVAIAQRSIALIAAARPTDALPTWLQEVVQRAPARAATVWLQEAATNDKRRRIEAAANCWLHAAETLRHGQEFESWQRPFVDTAADEAAKRFGELSVRERQARQYFYTYTEYVCLAHRLVRRKGDIPTKWLEGFRSDEVLNVINGMRELFRRHESPTPMLSKGIDGVLCALLVDSANIQVTGADFIRLALSKTVENEDLKPIEI